MKRTDALRLASASLGLLTLAACSSESGTNKGITVYGSNAASAVAQRTELKPARLFSWLLDLLPGVEAFATPSGSPTSVKIKLYAAYASTSAACTSPVTLVDNGSTPVEHDFATAPIIASGDPGAGTYNCLILKMSDNIKFKADATAVAAWSPDCGNTSTEHTFDIYRDGGADDGTWKDKDGNAIDATGTVTSPGADIVYVYATTNTASATGGALGVSANQTLQLNGALTVPGRTTYYFDATNGIQTNSNKCWIENVTMGFI